MQRIKAGKKGPEKKNSKQNQCESSKTKFNKTRSQRMSWWKQKLEAEPRQFTGKDCHSVP